MKKCISYKKCRRSTGYPYAVTINRRIVARTRDERCAFLFGWVLAAEGILTDRRTLAFAAAVAGLLGRHAPDLKTSLTPRRALGGLRSGLK